MQGSNNPIRGTIPWLVLLLFFTAIFGGSNLYDKYYSETNKLVREL